MREREPMTQTMKASEARQNFSDVLNRVFRRETRVLVEKSGIPVAAIISAQDLDRLTHFDEQRINDFAILDEIRAAFRGVPPDEIEREVARAIQEVRSANPLPPRRSSTRP
jgi:prevent-host-death family protein